MTPALILFLVVGGHDGDTITVSCGDQTQEKIRLAEIDAPELHQAYGQRAKQALSDRIYLRTIKVEALQHDRYGRTVARLYLDGHEVQWDLIGAGLAWCYEKYLKQPEYRDHQTQAQHAQRGLWADPKVPVPPWEFRHAKKSPKP